MIIVYVKHYLTKSGMKFFNDEWFPDVKETISQQPGYVLISHDKHQDKDDCVNITVKFENETTLNDWVTHPKHDPFVNALDKYRSRNYWSVVKTEDDKADRDTLDWEEIKLVIANPTL